MPGVAPAPRSKTVDRDAEQRPAKYHDQSPRHWISGRGGTGLRWSRHGEVTLGAVKFLAPIGNDLSKRDIFFVGEALDPPHHRGRMPVSTLTL
jgi:hypothetical protein